MTEPADSDMFELRISDGELATFDSALLFWREQSESREIDFPWFSPRLWDDGSAFTGNRRDAAYTIKRTEGGYELILTVERDGDSAPTFYTRFDDAVKAVALVLGGSYRLRACPQSPLLTWRNSLAAGVDRETVREGVARYTLRSDRSVYCEISKYDGDEFSPALTMVIDEFNQAILEDPGDPIP